jgi:hypothetical protein
MAGRRGSRRSRRAMGMAGGAAAFPALGLGPLAAAPAAKADDIYYIPDPDTLAVTQEWGIPPFTHLSPRVPNRGASTTAR